MNDTMLISPQAYKIIKPIFFRDRDEARQQIVDEFMERREENEVWRTCVERDPEFRGLTAKLDELL